MEGVRIQNKLKLLFQNIVDPKYVMNSYYADGLINKLSNCSDPDMQAMCTMPIISDLISDALDHIDDVHGSVHVFLTRFLAIVSTKELHFTKIFHKQGNQIVKIYREINSPTTNPSLKVAAMEVALGIVQHNSGVSWLLETGVWKEILSLCNEKQTVFVIRQAYTFIARFLWRLNDLYDLANIKHILSFILKAYEQYDFITIESLSSEQEEELSKTLDPTLHILIAIVSTENRIEKPSILLETLIEDIKINHHLRIIFDRMRRPETCLLLAKVTFWFVFAKMFLNKVLESGAKFNAEDFMELNVTYFNTIQFLVQRRNAILAVDFCTECNLICWTVCKGKENLVRVIDGKQIVLRNEMLFMVTVPLLVFVRLGKPENNSDERLEDYMMRLWKSTCEHTAKAAYALRSLLLELDTMQIVIHSVKKIACLKRLLNYEQANLVFQALFYVLREYDPIDDFGVAKQEEGLQYEDTQDKVLVMTYVMDTVLCLLRQHNINWHESLEVLCLYTVVYNILQRPNLTTKFVVASLNVITMTVTKFLPPNLSLLLDTKPGSTIDHIGKLIYKKLHDRTWEVRDSALELLLVCTEISYVKFPPFQKQILDDNLINVAASLAFNDYESYVQVSALKCIGAASKICNLWENLTIQYPNIQDQLIATLRNNQEGIVRKEACNVLCDIYQNKKLTAQFKLKLYEHMVSSTLSDFHWEVQICALKFWKIVIQSLLTDQGMLDGTFPPVTFSRESRKIVTLNETEIQKRLIKILDELSTIGLLTVLIKLLHEDTEVAVLDCSVCVASALIDILNKYNVLESLKPVPDETIDEIMCHIKEDPEDNAMVDDSVPIETSADNIIEGILNSDDINLLASIYERHMSLQTNKPEESLKPKIKISKMASPHLFVSYVKSKDFKAIVEDKRKWNDGIRNISSLLDDVLGLYEDNEEVNALDCY